MKTYVVANSEYSNEVSDVLVFESPDTTGADLLYRISDLAVEFMAHDLKNGISPAHTEPYWDEFAEWLDRGKLAEYLEQFNIRYLGHEPAPAIAVFREEQPLFFEDDIVIEAQA